MEEITNKLKDIEFNMAIILLTEDLKLTEESQFKTNFIFERLDILKIFQV